MQLVEIGTAITALATGGSIALAINRYMRHRATSTAQYSRWTRIFGGCASLLIAAASAFVLATDSEPRFYLYIPLVALRLVSAVVVLL